MKTITYLTISATLAASAAEPLPLIPLPAVVQPGDGNFTFSEKTGIRYAPSLACDAKLFAGDLTKLTGKPPALVTKGSPPSGP